jgi:hypothetical protein
MAYLEEKQYELGGVVFGLGCPIAVKEDGWSPGQPALRTADKERPVSDGIRVGRTRLGAATWGFTMFTTAQGEDGVADPEIAAWEAYSELADVWSGDEVRDTPETVMPLRYRIGGETRRVYGQPRRWQPTLNNLSLVGRIDVVADFTVVDPLVYDDDLQTHDVPVAPPQDTSGGLRIPFRVPARVARGAGTRQDRIQIGGSKPTPITLIFNGPIGAGATVKTELWTARLEEPVAGDDPVTIDASPWVRSATKRSGGGVKVSARTTHISKMLLPPGWHDISFTGSDPTGTASVTVAWRNARRSIR